MNSQSKAQQEFQDKMAYFGIRMPGRASRFRDEYCDLEQFFLEATLHFRDDVRTTQALIHWMRTYGCLLSPSKMRRLILNGQSIDRAILGFAIDLISEHSPRLQSWKVVGCMAKKLKVTEPLFVGLPIVGVEDVQLAFKKWGLIAPPFGEAASKFLRDPTHFLDECPELRFRAEGYSVVAADLRALIMKCGLPNTSVNKIAQKVNHPCAQINGYIKQFQKFKVA